MDRRGRSPGPRPGGTSACGSRRCRSGRPGPARSSVERRALRLHRADLHRARCACAATFGFVLALMPFEVEGVVHRPRRVDSGMLSAVKLCQSSSISGPSATAKPRSAKISASSSITWLTGWTVPLGISWAGSDRSIVSVASLRSSSAVSSADLRSAIADVTCSRKAWIFGASAARDSGSIEPSDFNCWVMLPDLPSTATRN